MAVGQARARARAALVTALAAGAAGGGAPAAAAPLEEAGRKVDGTAEAPALSIDVSDDLDGVSTGQETEYTVTLRNNGAEVVRDLLLTQSLSPELEIVRVGEDGRQAEGVAAWEVTVPAGEEVRRTVRARLGETGEETWRVATTVCAQTDGHRPPVVCATDANRVRPADRGGGAAPAAVRTRPPGPMVTGVAVALGAVIAATIVALLWQRRRDGRAR